MTDKNREMIYEGKAKILYQGDEEDTLIQHFKDDVTAFNKQKQEVIADKGMLNNFISEHIMLKLTENGISNHFIKRLDMQKQLVRKVEIIAVEVIIRNFVAGSLAKRFGFLQEGEEISPPLVEFSLKNDELGDPFVADEHLIYFGIATKDELEHIKKITFKINNYLQEIFSEARIKLVDLKLEFGRVKNKAGGVEIILADEISPDNCRLHDMESNEKLDKDRFREGLGGLVKAYREVANRLKLKLPK